MKKVLFAIIVSVCAIACTSTPEMNNSISNVETLPTGQCLYSVDVKDSIGYTFIDSCGKYSVGEKF